MQMELHEKKDSNLHNGYHRVFKVALRFRVFFKVQTFSLASMMHAKKHVIIWNEYMKPLNLQLTLSLIFLFKEAVVWAFEVFILTMK